MYQLEAAHLTGWTAQSLRLLGDAHEAQGDLRAALAYWESAASANADLPLLRRLAEGYIVVQDWSQAKLTLDRLIAVLPEDASDARWARFQRGILVAPTNVRQARADLNAAAMELAYRESAGALLTVIANEPIDPTRLALVLLRQELWAYAEYALSYADPITPQVLAYRGFARDQQGKDSEPEFSAALRLAPADATIRYLNGLHLRRQGDYGASLGEFIAATALEPNNAALYAELGSAYRLVNDLDNAERWLGLAVQMADDPVRWQPLLDEVRAAQAQAISAAELLLSLNGSESP